MPASSSAVALRDICILRLSALGDVCNLVPTVRALQQLSPHLNITWVIGPAEYSLLAGLEGVTFVVYDKKSGLAGMYRLRQQLIRQRQGRPFEVLLHMQAALRASVLSRFIPARRRVGFDRARAKDRQDLFVSEHLSPNPRSLVGEGFLDFARYLGASTQQLRWDIPIPEQAEAEAANWSKKHQPYLVLSPCSSERLRNWRNWHAEGYARLIDYAHQRYGLTTLITGAGSTAEKAMVDAIVQHARVPVINTMGQTSLKALLALIRDARLVVAPDSGPVHMAAAMNTPVLGLYVTSNPQRTGPWRGAEWVVNRYPDAVRQFLGKTVDDVSWGQRVRHPDAMSLITDEDVMARLDAIMAAPGPMQEPMNAD